MQASGSPECGGRGRPPDVRGFAGFSLPEHRMTYVQPALGAAGVAWLVAGVVTDDDALALLGAGSIAVNWIAARAATLAALRSGQARPAAVSKVSELLALRNGMLFFGALFALFGVVVGIPLSLIAHRGQPTSVGRDVAVGAGAGAALGFAWMLVLGMLARGKIALHRWASRGSGSSGPVPVVRERTDCVVWRALTLALVGVSGALGVAAALRSRPSFAVAAGVAAALAAVAWLRARRVAREAGPPVRRLEDAAVPPS